MAEQEDVKPWRVLGALCLGFFMVLADMTIVSVANPSIMIGLGVGFGSVVWITSAYLLAYTVPVLTTGRLGDRYGPRNIYLAGLALFTMASLACALSTSLVVLVAARIVQGLGAACMTPQTLTLITRVFPPDRRGRALGVWGSVAGVSALIGPIAGGFLVDFFDWRAIFLVNVPLGVVAFVLAARLLPVLPVHEHRFDGAGVLMSAIAMFCIVFALQEGHTYDWSAGVWILGVVGLAVAGVMVWQQSRRQGEPLLPVELFRDRNFALANVSITAMAFSITAFVLQAMFYAQAVRGFSPPTAAMVFAPLALTAAGLTPAVGWLVDRVHPRFLPTFGFIAFGIAQLWFAAVMTPDIDARAFLAPVILMGAANACLWAPLSATATRNLPTHRTGAGSGIYNTTRLIGSVLGSASAAALVVSRMSARGIDAGLAAGRTGQVPAELREPLSRALSEAMLLPAGILVAGLVASALFTRSADPNPVAAQLLQPEHRASTRMGEVNR